MLNKDLKKEAEMLHEANRFALKEGQEDILPILIISFKKPMTKFAGNKIDKTDRVVLGIPWDRGTKEIISMGIGHLITKHRKDIECLIFSADAWMVEYSKKKKYLETDPRPGEHPDRKETLLTSAFTPDMKKMYSISQAYERIDDRVKFEKVQIMDKKEGEYNLFQKMLGYYGN